MAISLLQHRLARLLLTDPAEDKFEDPEMLPPMFLGNDAGKSHCMTGEDFKQRVLEHEVCTICYFCCFARNKLLSAFHHLANMKATTHGPCHVQLLGLSVYRLLQSSPKPSSHAFTAG